MRASFRFGIQLSSFFFFLKYRGVAGSYGGCHRMLTILQRNNVASASPYVYRHKETLSLLRQFWTLIPAEYCVIRLVTNLFEGNKVTFRHSNIGLEPESQAFVFIDDDQVSDGYKLQNQKVKEYENVVPAFLENNEQESVKRSLTSPISNPAEGRDLPRNSVDGYMDKTVTECEPHLEVCYKESNYHVVKDICVDEGVLNKDKVMFVNTVDEKAHNFFHSESYENKEKQKDNTSIKALSLTPTEEKAHNFFLSESYENKEKQKDNISINVLSLTPTEEKAHNFFPSESKEKQKDNTSINVLSLTPTEESDEVHANHDQPKGLMHKDGDATEKISGNVNKEMKPLPEDKVLLQDLLTEDSVSSDDKGEQISNEPELHSQSEGSKNTVEEAILESPSLALADDESNNDNMLSEKESSTHQLDPSRPSDCGKEECHQAGVCKCDEIQQTMKPVEGKSDDQAVTGHIHHSLGEASFSSIGPMSGRISYSGPVPYSGSISLRSDSSTTSTRSFAFPIIQSEWNSSPVRMAKADRKHFRKQRWCWRDGFLCCKF
ncbi:hypothetical protein HKD37_01G000685 [Glycine soja]